MTEISERSILISSIPLYWEYFYIGYPCIEKTLYRFVRIWVNLLKTTRQFIGKWTYFSFFLLLLFSQLTNTGLSHCFLINKQAFSSSPSIARYKLPMVLFTIEQIWLIFSKITGISRTSFDTDHHTSNPFYM